MFEKEFRHIAARFPQPHHGAVPAYVSDAAVRLRAQPGRGPHSHADLRRDHSADSRALIERFRGSRFFEIEGFVDNYAGIEKAIDKSKVLMGLVIPRDYSQRISAGGKANVQILLDGSDSNTASIALGYVREPGAELFAAGALRRAGPPAPDCR